MPATPTTASAGPASRGSAWLRNVRRSRRAGANTGGASEPGRRDVEIVFGSKRWFGRDRPGIDAVGHGVVGGLGRWEGGRCAERTCHSLRKPTGPTIASDTGWRILSCACDAVTSNCGAIRMPDPIKSGVWSTLHVRWVQAGLAGGLVVGRGGTFWRRSDTGGGLASQNAHLV